MKEKTQHDGDCTIYASLHNGIPEAGICVCGYGWGLAGKEDYSEMYSEELQKKLKRNYEKIPASQRKKMRGLLKKLCEDDRK